MSATESAVVVPVEEVKPTEMPAVVADKAEEPAAVVADAVTPAVEADAATAEPVATEEPAKSESKADDEPKKDSPKGPGNFLTKLLSNFKGDKKAKAPKSPKKEKKEEVEATAGAEAPKEASASEVPAEVVEPVKEAEAAVAEPATAPEVPAVVAEEVKETPKETPAVPKADVKAMKVGRRLSSRVGDFFKSKPKTEVATPAKVDEHPPKIDEPVTIAPLENPAMEAAKVEEPAKPVEASAPVVAATA